MFISKIILFYEYIRLMFMSIYLAICTNEDSKYSKSFFAKIAGITLGNFLDIELDFIKLINYYLFVSIECFESMKVTLMT
jgi:hypothetical protein